VFVAVFTAGTPLAWNTAQALGNHVQCGDVITQDTTLGIHVDGKYGGVASVIRNIAEHNGDDGFDVAAPTSVVQRNTANENGDLGTEAVPGVIDGGGNGAFGNGNPLQCLNVVCQ
jgi:hypothetical protein